jgi:hypothetical protein
MSRWQISRSSLDVLQGRADIGHERLDALRLGAQRRQV